MSKSRLDRFPLSSSPASHPGCASNPVSPPTAPQPSRPVASPQQNIKDSAQLRAQVQQLQFWLRVFSRFCREDPEEEEE